MLRVRMTKQRPYIYDNFETVVIKKNLRSSMTIVNKDILQFQSKLHVQKKNCYVYIYTNYSFQ